MIKVLIIKSGNEYRGLQASGHAGFAEYGNDIVCAAVSMLIINTANSIEQFTDDFILADTHEDGTTELFIRENCSDKTILLMDSLLLGLNEIRKQYGKKYLRIDYKEV